MLFLALKVGQWPPSFFYWILPTRFEMGPDFFDKSENYARMLKCRLCGSPGDSALTKHTPGRTKDRRSQIYHQLSYRIQNVSSAYLQLVISMVFGVRLRTEHICLIYPQIRLKPCLSIVEYRMGKYQGMHWFVDVPVLPYVRLYLQVWKAESTRVGALDRILIRITPSRMG